MSARIYCHQCGSLNGPPDIADAVLGFIICECGEEQTLDSQSRRDAATDLINRLQALEGDNLRSFLSD